MTADSHKGWKTLKQRALAALGLGGILCDTCRYDYGSACRRRERPNARVCPDYSRGRRGAQGAGGA